MPFELDECAFMATHIVVAHPTDWKGKVRVVESSPRNLKVTRPEDLVLVRALLEAPA